MDDSTLNTQPVDGLDEQLVNDQYDLEQEPNKKKRRDILLIAIGVLLFLFIFLSLWTTPQTSKETAVSSTPTPRVASNITSSPVPGASGTPVAGASSATTGTGTSGSGGGSGSTSGGGGSNSSTSLTTHNAYNYYTTASMSPTPAPGSTPTPVPTGTPTPTPVPNPTPTPSSPTPTPAPTPTPTNTPVVTPTPAVLGTSTSGAFGLLTIRSATLGSSRPSGNTNIAFSWKTGTTATVRGIRILACTTPSDSTACVAPAGASFGSSSLSGVGGQLSPTWAYTINSANDVILTKAGGDPLTAGVTETVSLANFINPSTIGTYFFRVITYSTTTAANVDSVDFGAIAVSTAHTLTEQVDVAEALIFRVANTISACDSVSETNILDPNDSASDLVTLSPNPMTIAGTSTGTAQFCASTNAQNGYVITYADWGTHSYDAHAGFWNGSHEFNPGGILAFTSTPGTEQFGLRVAVAGPGSGTVTAPYNAATYSYNDSGSPVQLASTSASTLANIYTISYAANVSVTTPGGTYRAHQMFVCTATF